MKKILSGLIFILSLNTWAADFTITVQPAPGSLGANSSLSNLSPTAINRSLAPNFSANHHLGLPGFSWQYAWIDGLMNLVSNQPSLSFTILNKVLVRDDLDMLGENKISNLVDPVSNQDAATKAYVDSKLSSNIEVRYTISANERTITLGGGVLPFVHMKLDNRNAYNPTTGMFTAPADGGGLYLVSANLFTSATLNSSTSWFFSAIKTAAADSSVEVIAFDNKAGTGAPNTNNAVKLSGIIRLLPGDTIHIESSLDTNTTLPINQNYNQLSIVRISQ